MMIIRHRLDFSYMKKKRINQEFLNLFKPPWLISRNTFFCFIQKTRNNLPDWITSILPLDSSWEWFWLYSSQEIVYLWSESSLYYCQDLGQNLSSNWFPKRTLKRKMKKTQKYPDLPFLGCKSISFTSLHIYGAQITV